MLPLRQINPNPIRVLYYQKKLLYLSYVSYQFLKIIITTIKHVVKIFQVNLFHNVNWICLRRRQHEEYILWNTYVNFCAKSHKDILQKVNKHIKTFIFYVCFVSFLKYKLHVSHQILRICSRKWPFIIYFNQEIQQALHDGYWGM